MTAAASLTTCLQEINLIHSRITSCTPLNLPRFAASLKRLCLRENFISVVDPADFGPLVNLEEMDFYDNKIKTIGAALTEMPDLA